MPRLVLFTSILTLGASLPQPQFTPGDPIERTTRPHTPSWLSTSTLTSVLSSPTTVAPTSTSSTSTNSTSTPTDAIREDDEILSTDAGSIGCHCADKVACPAGYAGIVLRPARPAAEWENYYLSVEWVVKNRWAGMILEEEFSEETFREVEEDCRNACISHLDKCASFTVSHGSSDAPNAYPEFIRNDDPKEAFSCTLFSKNIDTTQYREAVESTDVWTSFKGMNIVCVNPT